MNGARDIQALFKKAIEHHSLGRLDDALNFYDAVLRLNSNVPVAHTYRGVALHSLNRFDLALESHDRAIELKPDYAEAYNNRGIALSALKRWHEAVRNFERAVEFKPEYAEAYYNKGKALKVLDRQDEAIQSYDRAIKLKPDYAEAYNNRGNALNSVERLDEAVRSYDRAIELKPDYAEAYYNRGIALSGLSRLNDAVRNFDRAVDLKSDYADAYWNKSICALLMSRFDEGWRLYEWRKKKTDPIAFRKYPQPVWLGEEDVEGKTLFVHPEQGLGDTIQFCRYAVLAESKWAKITLAVQDELMRLMGALGSDVKIVGCNAAPPDFDYHIPLLSMPLAFKTGENNIPAWIPYLRAEPDRVRQWKNKIGNDGFKIGICWQGNKRVAIDVGRSFSLRYFEGLSKLPNIRLISLQKNDGVEQLLDLPSGMKVETLGEDFDAGRDAFIDTAAVMECLDLVVTCDTAIAHLAGALARPVWVALKYVPDWRWLLDRADSPWYPTMRLFRQTSRDDWRNVFVEMEAALVELKGSKPALAGKSRAVATPEVPISWGELIDKITILEIKSERIASEDAVANVRKELSILRKFAEPVRSGNEEIENLTARLRAINERLWDVEDRIRTKEAAGEFDADFIELARLIYKTNDERGAVKKQINLQLASELVEEKSYENY